MLVHADIHGALPSIEVGGILRLPSCDIHKEIVCLIL